MPHRSPFASGEYANHDSLDSTTKDDRATVPRKTTTQRKSYAVSVRFDPAIKEAAERAASDDSRSLSSLIQKAVADYLRRTGYIKSPK
jgi:hypothetical protein